MKENTIKKGKDKSYFLSGKKVVEIAVERIERLSELTNHFHKSGEDIRSMAKYYINEGVIEKEAEVLAVLEDMINFKIPQLPPYWTWNPGQNITIIGYKMNNEGYITAIYISPTADPIVQYFPSKICNLKYLEEIVFQPIILKEVPQEIVNLSKLRVLILKSGYKISAPLSLLNLESLEYVDFFEFTDEFYEEWRKKSFNLDNQDKRYKEMLEAHTDYWLRPCNECDWCDDKSCITRIMTIDWREGSCENFIPKFYIE